MRKILKSLWVVAGFAAWGALAQAQTAPPVKGHEGMLKNHYQNPQHKEERITQHLNKLKQKLHISATQEPAWTTFAAAMTPPTTALAAFPDRQALEKLTTPERIDKMKELRTQHEQVMGPFRDQRDAAIKAFYVVLDAEQKKTFDAEHAHMLHKSPMLH